MRPRRSAGILLWLVSITFLYFSCAPRYVNLQNLPCPSAPELYERAKRNIEALRDFSGSGLVEFTSSVLPRSVLGLKVEYLSPDKYFIHFNGPFGLAAGSLVLSGDDYRLKTGTEQLDRSGKIAEFVYPPGLEFIGDGNNLRHLFDPLISSHQISDSIPVSKDLAARQFFLTLSDTATHRSYWADPDRPLFCRELVTGMAGDTLWDKQISEVKQRGAVYLPSSWTVRMGQKEEFYQVKIRFSQLKVNTGLSPDYFKMNADSNEVQGG